jgi:hypothetical protein
MVGLFLQGKLQKLSNMSPEEMEEKGKIVQNLFMDCIMVNLLIKPHQIVSTMRLNSDMSHNYTPTTRIQRNYGRNVYARSLMLRLVYSHRLLRHRQNHFMILGRHK